jgi:hypothetical protein
MLVTRPTLVFRRMGGADAVSGAAVVASLEVAVIRDLAVTAVTAVAALSAA